MPGSTASSAPASAPGPLRLTVLVAAALVAFAANSVLCRAALASPRIDPATFTALRLGSGAAVLLLIVLVRTRRRSGTAAAIPTPPRDRVAPLLLLLYAAGFSYAYLELAAGTGALLLFGTVQVTMFAAALVRGPNPRPAEWIGLAVALAGLGWLVAPGLGAPAPLGTALMVAAGIGWGGYTLRGRGPGDPISRTAGNFTRALPATAILLIVAAFARGLDATPAGAALAVTSGAVTSGLGYAIWYAALPHVGAARAALVQLLVPVITAVGGVLLLGEVIDMRLLGGGGLVILGVAGAIVGRR